MGGSYTAKRLPKYPGRSGWLEVLPTREASARLGADIAADYLIIGAGFTGLSAAHRLSEVTPGADIVLLDAGELAEGSAGRNSGFMIDLPHDLSSSDYAGSNADHDRRQTHLNRTAIKFATRLVEQFGIDDSIFNPCGKINGAATEKGQQHNRDYAQHLSAMNEPFEWFDAQRMEKLTGVRYYRSGLFTPGTVMIQPAAFIRALGDALPFNCNLYENSPVVKLEGKAGKWKAFTAQGSVETSKVILAVNGHAESFGFFKRRLMHVFTYASMTHRMSDAQLTGLGGEANWNVTPADPMGVTVRRISGVGGERIVVRSRFTCDPGIEVSNARLSAVGKTHDRQFVDRFPMLQGVGMEYRWGGQLCLSVNGVGAFGEIDQGLFAACCQNGLGVAKGTLSGMAAAEMAAGKDSDIAQQLCAMDAPKKLPPNLMTWIGANAVMRYKEWQAGAE